MPIFQAGSASVSIVPDFRNAQRAIGEWFAKQGDLNVGVKPDLNNADMALIKAELSHLNGEASVRVDRKAFSSDLAAAMSDAFKGATGLFDFGSALTSAIGPAVKVAVGGLATELAAALAPAVTGSLALLPALLAGLAGPLAAIAVGVHGIGDAFKALGSGNLQQIQQAMDKLAPSARDFVTQVHALGPAWTALRLDVQQQLFWGLGTAVTNLAHVALPVLRTGLSDIATSLNAGLVVTMRQLAQDAPQFTNIFKNVNTAVGEFATQGLPKLAQTFVTLASVGSQFLPQIVNLLDGVISKFSDWVNRMNASGQLAQLMQNAIGILQQVFNIVGSILGAVGNIFKAALPFGQALMVMLQRLTDGLKTFLGTDTAQSSLKLFFGEITNAVQIILPTLQSLAQVVVTAILPAIGDFVQALAPLAATLGGALASALSQIAVLVPPLAQTVAALISAFAPLIPIISQLVLTLLPPLLQVFHELAPVISQLTQAFGAALLQAIQAVAPYIKPLGDAFISVVKALMPILPILGQIVASLLPPLARLIIALAPVVVVFANAIMQVLRALNPLWPLLAKLIEALLPPLTQLIVALSPFIGQLAQVFVKLIQAILPILPPLTQLLSAILPPLINIFSFFAKIITTVFIFALNLLVDAIKFVVTILSALFDAISWLLTHASELWHTVWTAVKDFFLTVWHAIVDWFEANIIHWFSVTFVNFFTTTIPNAFKAAWQGVKDWFVGLWNDLIKWFHGVLGDFGSFFSGFWTDLKQGLSDIWHGILHALEAPVQIVIDWVWNKTLMVAWNALNNLWGGTDLKPFFFPGFSAADGAVLPGFTPGRDVHHFFSPTAGALNLSGGEAVMRPEFTAAVGSGWVNSMNATARTGGVSGVQSALGMSFADGGVFNPDWSSNVSRGDRSLNWVQSLAQAVIPFLPGGDLLGPLTKYLVADASASSNQGGSNWFSILGATFRHQLNNLWDFAKSMIIKAVAPGGGAYANYHAAQAAQAAAAANAIGGNPILGASTSSSANVITVHNVANGFGWGTDPEWSALSAVIMRESGFRNTAANPTSTAYGMFQFLDSTWRSFGPKTSDPLLQAKYGLEYISERYHDPLGALAHEQAFGWYDHGGYLPPGWSTVYNGTGRNELVLNPQQQTTLGQRLSGGGFNVGGVNIQMHSANPYEVTDELVYRLRVASRGGVYSTVRG